MSRKSTQPLSAPHFEKSTRGPIRYATELPASGYVRLPTILTVFPVGRSTWWKGVRDGRFPSPIKLGPRSTAWHVADIRALLDAVAK